MKNDSTGGATRSKEGATKRRVSFGQHPVSKYGGLAPSWLLLAASLYGAQCVMNVVFFAVFSLYKQKAVSYETILFYDIFMFGTQALLALYCLAWKYAQYQVVRYARNVPSDGRLFFATFFYIRDDLRDRFMAHSISEEELREAQKNEVADPAAPSTGAGSASVAASSSKKRNPRTYRYEPSYDDVTPDASSIGLITYLRYAHYNHVTSMLMIGGSEVVAFIFAMFFLFAASTPIYLAVTSAISLTFATLLWPFVIYCTYRVFCAEPKKIFVI